MRFNCRFSFSVAATFLLALGATVSAAQPGGTPARTQVHFNKPSGMKVFWQTLKEGKPVFSSVPLETPGRYNFTQGAVYRLKLTHLAGHPGLELFPTLEVKRTDPRTSEFLSHNSVPLQLTEMELQHVVDGNYIVKVIYLPNAQFQDPGTGPGEIVSTQLNAGQDPVGEAARRGSILLVLRIGNIDGAVGPKEQPKKTSATFSPVGLLSAIALVPDKKLPPRDEPKEQPATAFKPIEINNNLNENDPNDPKLQKPSKKYSVKLAKDKTYIIDLVSKDFDAYLRLLDKQGNQLAEDDDGGGDLNSRIIHAVPKDGDYDIVVTTFDGQVGMFALTVREFKLAGEAKPRDVAKEGLVVNDQINQNDVSALGKLGKLYTVQLKAGQTYTINLESQAVDSYLYLFDGNSKLLAQDDDSGGDLNSRIVFRADRDDVYHIIATSLAGDETGEFSLKVSRQD